jgi:uncharacterized protein YjiS (DUF1127 family)
MSATTDSNLLSRAFDWIKARASRDNELAAMSHMDLHYLAADLGITEADVRDVVPKVTDHSNLMDKMMRARGLNPDAVRRSFSAVVRDMELTCARCRESRICRRELQSGTATVYAYDFCANADTMDMMDRTREVRA